MKSKARQARFVEKMLAYTGTGILIVFLIYFSENFFSHPGLNAGSYKGDIILSLLILFLGWVLAGPVFFAAFIRNSGRKK
jgi:hypothetical protein